MTATTTETPAAPRAEPPPRGGFLRSPTAKFVFIALLSLLLIVPQLMVYALKDERAGRRDEVVATIARDWAGPQRLFGPVLLVPYTVATSAGTRDGLPYTATVETRTAVILPERFALAGDLAAETRRLSLYEVPVYGATATLTAHFGPVGPEHFPGDVRGVDRARAVLSIGISDLGGIETADLAVAGTSASLESGVGVAGGAVGLHAALPAGLLDATTAGGFDVTLALRLKGSGGFQVAPVGRTSEVKLASNWPHPGFSGGTLPSERALRPDGFEATWRVPQLARNVPQTWTAETEGYDRFDGETVGVDLAAPLDLYALVDRALKYGLMFVGAVFGIVFVLEILSPRRIHIVQYALVGLVLVFFYVLLLAFAEQIGFGPAYAVASLATGGVVTAFVGMQLGGLVRTAVAAGAFGALFGLLYAILRLEDVALMAGAVTGFVLLTVVLFATRRVDWSGTAPAGT
ncbi:cell envelope integrity protein CreD [Oharaeibacter diazotrophicus]|uniref:Inner membrane protein n=1 Tax=Oharaeibacter diazotrophicus TaxID=1920512 RepID=A0A4V6PVD4_9HYPH|nr:cell envelope integrity protein CreD [Oharaeibacter diazotrophicus]TDP81938.1 inner membrane protein [Oharaeibacter diazotrophicus]BBE73570.1 inner membrane protein CreD [Pleomorphomonas sp. SM30]GLS75360.1 cell envelope integrity protein CreD [Oharaeibacter diazotrophicus]